MKFTIPKDETTLGKLKAYLDPDGDLVLKDWTGATLCITREGTLYWKHDFEPDSEGVQARFYHGDQLTITF